MVIFLSELILGSFHFMKSKARYSIFSRPFTITLLDEVQANNGRKQSKKVNSDNKNVFILHLLFRNKNRKPCIS
jgi:hypothetical protein